MMNQSAQGLASLGRNGDSMLVHMSPQEVRGLQSLAMAQGGSLTINPNTGMPEAFSLKGMFKSFLPTLAGAAASFIPGMQFMSPLVKGILAGATTGALTNKDNRLLGAITGGLGGYGGASIGQAATAAGAVVPKSIAETSPYKGGFVNTETATGAGYGGANTTGADLAQNAAILNNTNQFGNPNLAVPGTFNPALSPPTGATVSTPTFMGNLSAARTGAGEIFSGNQAAIDAYTKSIGAESGLGALGKTMLPVGGAALGGLEKSDIYGTPMQKPEAEKYDPYARLDLSADTDLRLVAEGGYIDGYATGGSIQSGGIRDLYGTPDNTPTISTGLGGFGLGRLNNLAGEQAMAQAQTLGYAKGGYLNGAGDGMSDSIPATIEGKQPARLADGEFVIPADVVSHLGNGSTKAGSKRLYAMLDKVRKARTGTKKQGKQINPAKYMPA